MQRSVSSIGTFTHEICTERASASVLFFLRQTKCRKDLKNRTAITYSWFMHIQKNLNKMMKFNNYRFTFLQSMWNHEVQDYQYELSHRKSAKARKIGIGLSSMNQASVTLLLECYLDRCKFVNAFAFIQFRKLLPKAELHSLKEIFRGRKDFILRVMGKVRALLR
jgi:hypothetical protein